MRLLLMFLLAVGVAAGAVAQEAPAPAGDRNDADPEAASGSTSGAIVPAPPPPELTPETIRAIDEGLHWLKRSQKATGAWDGGEYPVAVTALCGLAFLASGSTPTSGPYAENVRRAMGYLIRQQRPYEGLFYSDNDSRPMYGHGFALLFLAECYGMSGNVATKRPLEDVIRKAIKRTSDSQTAEGGWYYTPTSDEDEGSVTISQIQALRAARNAGFHVDKRVIDRAIGYIRKSQDPDGGVKYTSRYGRSSLALTGAGLAVLYGAGDYDSKNVESALEYVRTRMDTSSETPHFHYTHFYLAQALHQNGGSDWERYFPRIRSEILGSRMSRGCWTSQYGAPYATALSLLVLEIPLRYLPIYER